MALVGRLAPQNQQPQDNQSFLSKAGGFLKDIGLGIIRSGVQTAAHSLTSSQSPISPLNKISLVGRMIEEKIPESVNLPILGETSLKYSKEPIKAVGQMGEDILNVGLVGSGGVAAITLKEAGKLTAKEIAEQAIKTTVAQKAKTALKDFGVGFGYGVSSELQNKDKTVGSVLKSGLVSGAVGTVLPPVLGGGLKIAGKATSMVGRMASKGLEKVATTLEEKAGVSIPKIKNAIIQIGDKTYTGADHLQAIKQAADSGEDVSKISRELDGKFETTDGRVITRDQAEAEFGVRHSEEVPQLAVRQGREAPTTPAELPKQPVGEVLPAEATTMPSEMKPVQYESVLRDKALQRGVIKDVEFTDRTIKDTQTGKPAPSGVVLGERKLMINRNELSKDISALTSDDAATIASRDLGEYTRKPNETNQQLTDRYINDIVNFEENHIKTGTIGEADSLYTGIGAKETAKQMDTRAVDMFRNIGKSTMAVEKKNPIRYYQNFDKPVQTTGQKIAGKTAEVIRGIQKLPQKFETKILDKYANIRRFQEKAKSEGIDTPDLQEMTQGAQYRAAGKAENRLDDYLSMRKQYGNEWQYVKEYSHYMDDLDRLAQGNTIAGNRTADDVTKSLQALAQDLTPDQLNKVKQGQVELQKFLDQELQGAVASGRISKEGYNAIKAAHPNYIPHNVLDFLDEGKTTQGLGKSFNVAKSGIEKAKGSAREIDDIDNAIVDRLYRQNVLNEKNQTVKAVIDVGRQIGEKGNFIPLRTSENVNKRIDILTKLKNLFSENRKDYRTGKVIQKESNLANKLLTGAENKEYNQTIKNIGTKFDDTKKELNNLIDEAQTLASEFDNKSSINAILDKAFTKEKQLYKLNSDLSNQISEFNLLQKSEIIKRKQILDDIKLKQKAIDLLIDGRKNLILDLRNSLQEVTDIKIKSVDIPDGFEKISYFNNGVKEDWLIPDDLGRALKNLDGQEASAVMNWLNNTIGGKVATASARAIRKLATGLSPVFALFSNPARDLQTIALTSEAGADDVYRGLIKTMIGKEDPALYRLAKESGALQGSIFREGKSPEQLLKDKLEKQGLFSKIIRPDKAIEAAGQKMEEMTRMIVFKKSLEIGKTPSEAAKLARNATVDFGKSGEWIQVANKVIPFLNARIQGAANLVSAIRKDPTKAVRALMWSAAYPATVLNAYNSKYESYQNIPDYERRKFWIVMVGENKGKDYNGKSILVPHYVKIPKGEAQQAVSNITERILNLGKEKYPDTTAQFLGKVVADFSPVTESSILPAGLQQLVETQSNYSFFQQRAIEPMYVRPTGKKSVRAQDVEAKYRYNLSSTSEIAKYIGSVFNWSPSKIDYVIKTGVMNDLLRLYDIPVKGLKGESKFEKASSIPFFRSLVGVSTAGITQKSVAETQAKTIQKNTQKIEKQLKKKDSTATSSMTGRMAK